MTLPSPPLSRSLQAIVPVLAGRRVVVLTGAGCSTESGIPDYRGPQTRAKARNPIQYRSFIEDPAHRQRYWSRAVVGYPRMLEARPNSGHAALAAMERAGHIAGVITQNVDRLHTRAGSANVIELHGALAEVICLACRAVTPRDHLQARALEANPAYTHKTATLAPDGDADLEPDAPFHVPPCEDCGGVLKPNVVFFGENVPKPTYDAANALFDTAEALLVVGSSLAVYSGYRFVHSAGKRGVPVVMINLGAPSRGREVIGGFVEAPAGKALPVLEGLLGRG